MSVSRADLESAVMRGLAVAGRPLVAPADATARAARAAQNVSCRDAACWARLGTALEAGWLVAGSAVKKDARFRVTFQLVRATDGSVVASEDNNCEVADCSIAELARRSARELVRQTLGRGRPALAAPEQGRAVEPPTPPEVTVTEEPAPDPADDRRRRIRRIFAFGALGTGALAIAGGVVALVAFPDECIQRVQPTNRCLDSRDYQPTRVGGIVAIAGGAVASAVGAYLLISDRRGASVAVGVGPGNLSIAGRF
jgi:hypothetical protein